MDSVGIGRLGFCFAVDFGVFRHRRGIVGQYYRRRAYFNGFFMGNFRENAIFSLSALLIKKWLKFTARKPARIAKWQRSI